MTNLPTGTVTFLFTDIEGSTRLWQQWPGEMPAALARHDAILRAAVERHGGVLFRTVGDGICAAFASPVEGVLAARWAQQDLSAADWPGECRLRARMAVHTGP